LEDVKTFTEDVEVTDFIDRAQEMFLKYFSGTLCEKEISIADKSEVKDELN
jgi:hypothetical protein